MAEFNLWDVESGSFIGKYADAGAALATVKQLVDHYGPDYAEDLGLGRIGDDGCVLAPLSGSELVAKVHRNAQAAEEEGRLRVIASTGRRVSSALGMAASVKSKAAGPISRGRDGAWRKPAAPKRDNK